MIGVMDARVVETREQWDARVATLTGDGTAPRTRRSAITRARILETASRLIEEDGFEALTMRRVAAALDTGPASLYAHVRDKAELADLLLGELCASMDLPAPDAAPWRVQFADVCRQLRDRYVAFPGISRAVFDAAPQNLDVLRVHESLFAIALAGGVDPRRAAWAVDAALLYVAAYGLEAATRRRPLQDADGRTVDRRELTRRLRMLPEDRFPATRAHAAELTAGRGHERFDLAVELLLDAL